MHCFNCGTENKDERLICVNCGAELKLVCPFCKNVNENSDNALFCTNCGKQIMKFVVCPKCGFKKKANINETVKFCGGCGKEIEPELPDEYFELKDEAVITDSLPEKIIIGSTGHKNPIYLNVKENGNILINTKSSDDWELSHFLGKIALKLYDSFPLGAVRINFVDSSNDVLFSKFRFGDNSETIPARIFEDFHSVEKYAKNKIEEILNGKLSGKIENAYDLYKIDTTEHFDYFIIRNGFGELTSSKNNLFVQTMAKAFDIKNDSPHHKCGIRFIIVNDNFNSSENPNFQKIQENAELVIEHNGNDDFVLNNEKFISLNLSENNDLKNIVEKKCGKIGSELKEYSGKKVYCEDIGFGQIFEDEKSYEPIIKIPVGKSGSEIIELPFSCDDKYGTFGGKKLGFMCLGTSGSGKSSLFNSIVINGCSKYSPKDLNFWLLDFKENATAGLYLNCEKSIPHIKLVAPNSKILDGYNILSILEQELNYRYSLISNYGNIVEYNKYVDSSNDSNLKHLPRIILLIDEAQSMFGENDSNSSDLPQKIAAKIRTIVTKGRASGIHLAFFAQDFRDPKSHLLRDSLTSSMFEICFRLRESDVRDSGFSNSFKEKKDIIESLGTGVMYLPVSDNAIKKCKVSYIDSKKPEILSDYFGKIIAHHPEKSEILKIGLTERLTYNTKIVNQEQNYLSEVLQSKKTDKGIFCVLGENSYTLRPIKAVFSSKNVSSAFIIGESKTVSTSIFASLLISLRNYQIFACDCSSREEKSLFKELLNLPNVQKFSEEKIDDCIRTVYRNYNDRKQKYIEDENYIAEPMFLFLNDFENKEQFENNISLKQKGNNQSQQTEYIDPDDPNAFAKILAQGTGNSVSADDNFDIRIKESVGKLLDDGYKYNIFVVLSLKNTYFREAEKALNSSSNVFLFNNMNYQVNWSGGYVLKDLLKDIAQSKVSVSSITDVSYDESEEIDNESFSLIRRNGEYSKFRPVIYSADEFSDIKEKL